MRWRVVSGSVAAVLVIAALVVWSTHGRGAEPPAGDRRGAAPEASGGARSAPVLPVAGASTATGTGSARPPRVDEVSPFGAPGTLAAVPARYVATKQADGHMFVNLAGGASTMYSPFTAPPAASHELRVTVLDRAHQPVAGAIVVVDDDAIVIMGGTLSGAAGGTTDAHGEARFAIPEHAMRAVALHSSGWSPVVDVAPGATSLALAIAGHGALTGRATYNGHPETFALDLKAGAMRVQYESNADGTFTIASLAPGPWHVEVGLAQAIAGGASKRDARDIVIEDGKTTTLEIAQTTGTDVVLEARLPANATSEVIEAFLFPGGAAPPDPATVHDRARAEHVPSLLFGGSDAMRPIQFHDVAPGGYLACEAGRADFRHPPAFWGCAQVTVLDGDTVREVPLALRAL